MNKRNQHKESALPQTALMAHTQATRKVVSQCSERAMKNCITGATLMPHLMQKETIGELMQLQGAVLNRLQKQYQDYFKGYVALLGDYAQIRHANTMTKLVSQQFNLLGQFGQLINEHTTELIGLQENMEVDFGYWASQKVNT